MDNSLLINNMYAAYSATSSQSDKNVANLSRLIKSKGEDNSTEVTQTASLSMDKVIISTEALSKLKEESEQEIISA